MRRLWFIVPLCVVALLWSGFLKGQDKKTDKEPIIVTARLPQYYSKLGLTQKQRTNIYKIRGKYAAQIQELQQKISDLKDQEQDDCENVLTADQKARLKEYLLRSGTRKNRDAKEPEANNNKKDTAAKDKKKDKAKGDLPPVEIKK